MLPPKCRALGFLLVFFFEGGVFCLFVSLFFCYSLHEDGTAGNGRSLTRTLLPLADHGKHQVKLPSEESLKLRAPPVSS